MEDIKKYNAEDLAKIVEKYPYFVEARQRLFALEKRPDKLLDLLLRVGVISLAEKIEIKPREFLERSTMDIIGSFLSSGEHRIVPKDTTLEDDLSLGKDPLEDDEILSEELAEIMLSQGLKLQAKQMYLKLSLLYPKKSVYFAEIISKIESEQ